MAAQDQHRAVISEIIAKQAVILGPEIAILKARNVPGLKIDEAGKVLDIKGDPVEALNKLIDVYVDLSGQIVKSTLASIFSKYPGVKKD